jgi:folate-dependent phosphoribosylglycinamide formyltransferase PurN
MRIFILTQEEPFYLPVGMEKLVRQKKKDIIGATILPRFGKKSRFQVVKNLFPLYGPRSFFIQFSEFVIFKILNTLNCFIKFKRFYSVKRVFSSFSIPIIAAKNVNNEDYIKKIKQLKPDLIISFACPQILKKEILSLPPLGCINVHGSLLPRYRGKNIGFWVLLNKEKETGISVHYINEKIDAGGIILQKKIRIDPKETVHSLYRKVVPQEGNALITALELIEKEKVKAKPIKVKKEDYFSDPKIEDIKRFRALGKKFR